SIPSTKKEKPLENKAFSVDGPPQRTAKPSKRPSQRSSTSGHQLDGPVDGPVDGSGPASARPSTGKRQAIKEKTPSVDGLACPVTPERDAEGPRHKEVRL